MDDAKTPEAAETKTKKKDKVRSAWIAFAGRIVAQLVGAIATVALGVMVLHRYTSANLRPPAEEPAYAVSSQPVAPPVQPPQQGVHVIIISPEMLALRDADERLRAADRGCTPELDHPAPSAAHINNGALLSR